MHENEIPVSVITPCYNSADTIEKTLECIENQTYKSLEYIIIDGGSTDGTLEIIERHKEKLPKDFTLVSEKDNGIYDAMNKGIRLAKGQLIGILNSDDFYENDTVEQAVKHYSGAKYEVVYGMQRNILNGREKAVFIYHHDFLPQQMITHPTCFVTADAYKDLGLFVTSYRSAADYDLMLRFYAHGRVMNAAASQHAPGAASRETNLTCLINNKKVVFTPVMRVMSNFRMGGMSGSQTGVRENALVRLRHECISKKRYYFIVLKSRLYEIFGGS